MQWRSLLALADMYVINSPSHIIPYTHYSLQQLVGRRRRRGFEKAGMNVEEYEAPADGPFAYDSPQEWAYYKAQDWVGKWLCASCSSARDKGEGKKDDRGEGKDDRGDHKTGRK